jgi:hypothetical protein
MDSFLRSINNSIYSLYIQARQKGVVFTQFHEWILAKVNESIYDRSKVYEKTEVMYAKTLQKQISF